MTKRSQTPFELGTDIAAIASILNQGNLCVEIIWSAMKYMKENPNCSIAYAIEVGYSEWIK